MADLTHNDLHRDLGRMEGRLDAMEDRLSKIETLAERIDERLARIEARESERRGIWWTLVTVATVLGSAIGVLLAHFWK